MTQENPSMEVYTTDESTDTNHNLNESADKIRLETKLTRGEGTRDQDAIKVKVRGDDPDEAVDTLNETLANLRETAEQARAIQPGEDGVLEGED